MEEKEVYETDDLDEENCYLFFIYYVMHSLELYFNSVAIAIFSYIVVFWDI